MEGISVPLLLLMVLMMMAAVEWKSLIDATVVRLVIVFSPITVVIVRISTIASAVASAVDLVAATAATTVGRPIQTVEAGLPMSGPRPGLPLVCIVLIIIV